MIVIEKMGHPRKLLVRYLDALDIAETYYEPPAEKVVGM